MVDHPRNCRRIGCAECRRLKEKKRIDSEFVAKVEALVASAGRPVSTGRSLAAGGKRINVALSAEEYAELMDAVGLGVPGACAREAILAWARKVNHRRRA